MMVSCLFGTGRRSRPTGSLAWPGQRTAGV